MPRHVAWSPWYRDFILGWFAQMGAGRAGWYSYNILDNGGVRSADHIVASLQHVSVGDLFPGLPGLRDAFFLLRFEPERFLVLRAGTRIEAHAH